VCSPAGGYRGDEKVGTELATEELLVSTFIYFISPLFNQVG
jgi:methylglyoxal synthase